LPPGPTQPSGPRRLASFTTHPLTYTPDVCLTSFTSFKWIKPDRQSLSIADESLCAPCDQRNTVHQLNPLNPLTHPRCLASFTTHPPHVHRILVSFPSLPSLLSLVSGLASFPSPHQLNQLFQVLSCYVSYIAMIHSRQLCPSRTPSQSNQRATAIQFRCLVLSLLFKPNQQSTTCNSKSLDLFPTSCSTQRLLHSTSTSPRFNLNVDKST
jgi:hypothetical protein